jgi:hypothetical protein
VAFGDFNRDGIPDLVATSSGDYSTGQGGNLSLLLGNGDGTFQPAVHYTAGLGPGSVSVADLNGDGILDVAVSNLLSGDVSVFLGKGDGTFGAPVNYAVGPFWAGGPNIKSSLAVQDFNGDGFPTSP